MKVLNDKEVFTDTSNDEDLHMVATIKQCLEINSYLPLIKEEIKLKIQCKRMISGEDELKLEDMKPVKHLLTEEEILKRNRRKEQNRKSAVRTRARQKTRIIELSQEVECLEEDQKTLTHTIHSLKQELQTLEHLLNTHRCTKASVSNTCRQLISLLPTVSKTIMIEGQ